RVALVGLAPARTAEAPLDVAHDALGVAVLHPQDMAELVSGGPGKGVRLGGVEGHGPPAQPRGHVRGTGDLEGFDLGGLPSADAEGTILHAHLAGDRVAV